LEARQEFRLPVRLESAADQGAGLALILEPFASPTEARLVAKLKQRFPRARVVAYAPLGGENVAAGIAATTGAAYEPVYHLDQARVILSLDADFLLEDRDAVRHAAPSPAGGARRRRATR
jgi:molybdopterin-containing oxidoreductase family iron-sulfur binding subunit